VAAAAFTWILAAGGARLRTLARLPLGSDLKAPVDFLVGAWVFATAAFLAGWAGWFRAPVLFVFLGILAAVGEWRRPGWRFRTLLPTAMSAAILLPIAIAPPFFYDALVYHLALPWQALQEGRLAAHSEDFFSAFPPLAQMLFAAPIAAGLLRVPALVQMASFILAGGATTALALRLGAPRFAALCAGALLPLLPAVVLVAGLPAAEGFAIGAAIAALALCLGPESRRAPIASAGLAGLITGIGTAARLQGLPWSLIVLALVTLGPAPRLRRAAGAALGWAAGSLPWWLKNLLLLRDPFAPIGWRRPGIETLWRDSGGQIYLAAGPADALRALGATLKPHTAYALPLLLAALLAMSGERPRRRVLAGLAAGAGLVAWAATGSLPRFLAPTLAVLLALAAAAARAGVGRWAGGLALGAAGVLGLVFTLRMLQAVGWWTLALCAGLADLPPIVVNTPLPAFAAAEALPADARVLFVGEARGFAFPRRAVVPSQHDVSPLRDPIETLATAAAARDRLVADGFTHLLVNRAELLRLSRDYPVLPWSTGAGQARFQALLVQCGVPVVKVGETAIFALR